MKKIILSMLLGCIFVSAYSNTNKIIIANDEPNNQIKTSALNKFKELMLEKNPTLEIIIENKDKENLINELDLGVINIMIPNTAYVSSKLNIFDLEVFNLPFVFSNENSIKSFTKDKMGESLLNKINEKNNHLGGFSYWIGDVKNFYAPNALINKNDFGNVNFKVPELNDTLKLFYGSLGVKKVDVGYTQETYTDVGLEDVTKIDENYFLTLSNHQYAVKMVIINNAWFNSLDKNIKDDIIVNLEKAGDFYHQENLNLSTETIKKLKEKNKVKELSSIELVNMKKSALSAHKNFYKNNEHFLNQIYEFVKKQK